MKRLGAFAFLVAFAVGGSAFAQLPAGHPGVGGGAPSGSAPVPSGADPHSGGGLPAGHPGVGAPEEPPGMFHAPPDETEEDTKLPPGTILVQLRNAANEVVPNAKITLGILRNSVAKGESREHKEATTDERGLVHFDGLSLGSGIAYRVSTTSDGGSFAAMPFQLPEGKGMRVVLHVYQVSRDMTHEQFFESAGAMYLELKDDRLLVQQAVRIFNATRFAWVPADIVLKLPEGFTALQSGMAMSDQGVDPVEGGARLRGTFPPGEHEVVFSWQLPYSEAPEIGFELSAPPRMGSFVVRAAASPGMQLHVDGFPAAMSQQSEEGQRMLVTAKRVAENEGPIPKVKVSLTDIPTRGPAAKATTLVALLALATGIYLGTRRRTTSDSDAKKEKRSARERLLAELDELERARRARDVGPKTYERTRRQIIDDIARTFAMEARAKKMASESASSLKRG